MLPRLVATRYVSPLREGGSLPGIVEADDLGTYVMKFRGAGQGLPALVAEVVVGELGRTLGLRSPDLAAIDLAEDIGRFEADQEVQDLLTASVGLNLGIDFLPGSFGYDGYRHRLDRSEAARVLWLDAFTANIDRTWRNPNLLLWGRQVWCIDHGAALYFHHAWERSTPERFAAQPYDTTDHVLGWAATHAAEADAELSRLLTPEVIDAALAAVPDDWLPPEPPAVRARYREHLLARINPPRAWVPVAP